MFSGRTPERKGVSGIAEISRTRGTHGDDTPVAENGRRGFDPGIWGCHPRQSPYMGPSKCLKRVDLAWKPIGTSGLEVEMFSFQTFLNFGGFIGPEVTQAANQQSLLVFQTFPNSVFQTFRRACRDRPHGNSEIIPTCPTHPHQTRSYQGFHGWGCHRHLTEVESI